MIVNGADKLERSLKGLQGIYTHAKIQGIHVKAAEPLVSRMHRLAPVGLTGELADSIGIVKLGKKATESGGVNVGPRRGGGFRGYHGHLVEFGTKQRKTKRTGANRGVMTKHPVVAPAWEQTDKQVLGLAEKGYEKLTVDYLKRTVPK